MAKWKLKRIGADYNELSGLLHVDPVLVRIMRNRGLTTVEEMQNYLNAGVEQLNSSLSFTQMNTAVELLKEACEGHKKVRVIGDYDIDGICGTAILTKGLREMGLHVDYAIPHRIHDGYGLNENLIRDAMDSKVELLITCDNGISAFKPILLAKENHIKVILTDHHEVLHDEEGNERIPVADAVINPKCQDSGYAFCGICGAYVAYHLLHAYHLSNNDYNGQNVAEYEREYLELAAFATVGDVMELIKENRYLVKFGLASMQNAANLGLRKLISATKKSEGEVAAYQIGFVYGPCINATGRLDTAERALRLLLEEDENEAFRVANELRDLNEERKNLTKQNVMQAMQLAEEQMEQNNKVLVIYLKDCHESLAGIIAGRIREALYRPTLVLTDSEEGLKGSGRSIENYDMFAGLCECADLFEKFGGHKMAAGFSLKKENLGTLCERLNQKCTLSEEDFEQEIVIDVDLPFSYVTFEFLSQLKLLEPCGNGNSRPVFAQQEVTFIKERIFGANRNCASYYICDRMGVNKELKFFGDMDKFHSYIDQKYTSGSYEQFLKGKAFVMSVIYSADVNEYRGKKEIQFVMQDYS